MDSISAFARGQANKGNELKVFDWGKAARLIKENLEAEIGAGLQSDWEWTGDIIWINGKPNPDAYTYLSSNWATPEIEIDGKRQDCYKMQSEVPDWDSSTYFPPKAMKILGIKEKLQ